MGEEKQRWFQNQTVLVFTQTRLYRYKLWVQLQNLSFLICRVGLVGPIPQFLFKTSGRKCA